MSTLFTRLRNPKITRAALWIVGTLAVIISPLLPGAGTAVLKLQRPAAGQLPSQIRKLPAPPTYDPNKKTAVILASNAGTESTDLLAPYAVLAASGKFNVYTLAHERSVITLFPGAPQVLGADFVPHYSFDEFDRTIGMTPDLIVVPFVAGINAPEDAPRACATSEMFSIPSLRLALRPRHEASRLRPG